MDIYTYNKINEDENLKRFIRENSYWYKYLNRNPYVLDDMIKDMKDKYKLNFTDKIEKFGSNLSLIKNVIENLDL